MVHRDFAETRAFQHFLCRAEIGGKVTGTVRIGAESDYLSAELAVAPQYFRIRMRKGKPFPQSRGIEFKPFAAAYQRAENFIEYIGKFRIAHFFFGISAVSRHIIEMPVYIKILMHADISSTSRKYTI